MRIPARQSGALSAFLVVLFSLALRCESQTMPAGPDPAAIAEQLRTIANAGTLAGLKYPNSTDYRQHVQALYQAVNDMPVWVRDGQPTPQAQAVITAFGV